MEEEKKKEKTTEVKEEKKTVEKKAVEKKSVEKKENKFKQVWEKFKGIFSKYPVTMITVILITLFLALVYESGGIFGWFDTTKAYAIVSKELLNKILMFGLTYSVSALFIECVFKNKKKAFSIVGFIVMAIIDIGFIEAFINSYLLLTIIRITNLIILYDFCQNFSTLCVYVNT